MASSSVLCFLLLLVVSFFATTMAGDPDILSDFVAPPFFEGFLDGKYFTYTGMRPLVGSPIAPNEFKAFKASMKEFPALEGQSVSVAVLQFGNGTVNPPHTHPRSAELLFLFYGCLEVGLIDTNNKLYTQTLRAGDMFVFPKGLVHYQYNADSDTPAFAVSAFGSASAGTVSLPLTLFADGIDVHVLAKAFKTDVQTIKKIKGGFIPNTW